MQYKKGIVVGRFQPFHKGHKFLIFEALKYADKIIIGIGNATGKGENDPYNSGVRKKILKKFIKNEGIEDRIIEIVPLVNNPSDDVWYENLVNKIGKVEVAIGNNEWVNGIFEGKGVAAIRPGHYKRNILEGSKIRKLMREGKKWEARIPEYLVDELKKLTHKY